MKYSKGRLRVINLSLIMRSARNLRGKALRKKQQKLKADDISWMKIISHFSLVKISFFPSMNENKKYIK